MGVRYQEHPHPLRIARQKKCLSVETLAAASGIGRNVIYNLEEGRQIRIYVDHLWTLGRILEVSWWSLAGPDNLSYPQDRPKPKRMLPRARKEPSNGLPAL